MQTIAVLGSGSWGTALAAHLGLSGHDVRLWARDASLVRDMRERRANAVYLPDVILPPTIVPTSSLEEALAGAGIVVSAVPSHGTRAAMREAATRLAPGALVVSATKGLEEATLLRMSQVILEEAGSSHPVVVLSGPSFAWEVARQLPAAVLVASLANDFRLWTDPSRARMPAIDRFQYVDGWPSGYGSRDTVEWVKGERARHPEGLTIVVRSRALPATQMALSVAFRRDAGVRIEDLPLDEPAKALPLLEQWARERPTVVVASLVDGERRPPPGTWGSLGVELVAETHKPGGQPCDAVYRVTPRAP